MRLDELDRKILERLERDARATLAEVGEAVGLSASAVKRRVDRMEAEGAIVAWTVVVHPEAAGAQLEAFIELLCVDDIAPADLASVRDLPEVVAAHTVAGDADALVRIRVDGMAGLERAIERLRRDPNVRRTKTMVVLSTLLDAR